MLFLGTSCWRANSTRQSKVVSCFFRRQLTYDDGKQLLALKRLIVKLRLDASFDSLISEKQYERMYM